VSFHEEAGRCEDTLSLFSFLESVPIPAYPNLGIASQIAAEKQNLAAIITALPRSVDNDDVWWLGRWRKRVLEPVDRPKSRHDKRTRVLRNSHP
jgi:hypothetical protein